MESAEVLRRLLDFASVPGTYKLFASLPKNSTALAASAVEGGADAIMLNVEGDDCSSPEPFGNYDLHAAELK